MTTTDTPGKLIQISRVGTKGDSQKAHIHPKVSLFLIEHAAIITICIDYKNCPRSIVTILVQLGSVKRSAGTSSYYPVLLLSLKASCTT